MLSPQDIGTTLPGGYVNALGGPVDPFYAQKDGTSWPSLQAACDAVPVSSRKNRTVNVLGIEHIWQEADTSNAGLKVKSGLGPSGPTGPLTAAQITDLREAVQDIVGVMFTGGNVTATYNDNGDGSGSITLTGATSTPFDPEAIRNTIGAAMVGVGLISVTINNAADTITISTSATQNSPDAQLRDRSTHTGTQPASTITGLSLVATTNSYLDLTDKPSIGTGNGGLTGVGDRFFEVLQAGGFDAQGNYSFAVPAGTRDAVQLHFVHVDTDGQETIGEFIPDTFYEVENGVLTLFAGTKNDGTIVPAGVVDDLLLGRWVVAAGTSEPSPTGVSKAYVDAQDRLKVEFWQAGRPAYADVLYYVVNGFSGTGFYKPKNNIGTSNVVNTTLYTFDSGTLTSAQADTLLRISSAAYIAYSTPVQYYASAQEALNTISPEPFLSREVFINLPATITALPNPALRLTRGAFAPARPLVSLPNGASFPIESLVLNGVELGSRFNTAVFLARNGETEPFTGQLSNNAQLAGLNFGATNGVLDVYDTSAVGRVTGTGTIYLRSSQAQYLGTPPAGVTVVPFSGGGGGGGGGGVAVLNEQDTPTINLDYDEVSGVLSANLNHADTDEIDLIVNAQGLQAQFTPAARAQHLKAGQLLPVYVSYGTPTGYTSFAEAFQAVNGLFGGSITTFWSRFADITEAANFGNATINGNGTSLAIQEPAGSFYSFGQFNNTTISNYGPADKLYVSGFTLNGGGLYGNVALNGTIRLTGNSRSQLDTISTLATSLVTVVVEVGSSLTYNAATLPSNVTIQDKNQTSAAPATPVVYLRLRNYQENSLAQHTRGGFYFMPMLYPITSIAPAGMDVHDEANGYFDPPLSGLYQANVFVAFGGGQIEPTATFCITISNAGNPTDFIETQWFPSSANAEGRLVADFYLTAHQKVGAVLNVNGSGVSGIIARASFRLLTAY